MKSSKILQVILWVLVALLSVTFFLFLSAGIQELSWYSFTETSYSDDYYEYLLENNDYIQIISTLEEDNRKEDEKTEHYAEYAAIAAYYKAASLYKAYMAVGDMDSAAMQQAIMERCEDEIVEYEGYIDNIHQLLQLDV